ncbi:MAG: GNAT family N-acetyltransferase [Polyangiaceae bacterium]|nr:GNAT family N-acetyltransferase [Polyangiaceae bacterium]
MTISVRKLLLDDERDQFNSGDPDLDRFFKRFAGQNQFKHYVGTTYVAVENNRIVGFATVSAAQVEVQNLPASKQTRLPRYPLPVLRLARLAVDKSAQGKGVGLTLLKAVFILARAMASDFGCIGVIVDAKPNAVTFYERYGFAALELVTGELGDRPAPVAMFLEIGAIPKATEQST